MTARPSVSNRIFLFPAVARTGAIAALSLLALTGTALADNLTGTADNDLLVGAVASSAITGKAGNDVLFGEPGAAMGPIAGIRRVSTSAAGTEANDESDLPSLSPDGNQVLFFSSATNLVADDTNGKNDIFVKNLITGVMKRFSTTAGGVEGNGDSAYPTFSPDGKRVAFLTESTNLFPDDTNATYDLVEKNLVTGAVTLVSSNSAGVQGNGMPFYFNYSPDGKSIAFSSTSTNLVVGDGNGKFDVFIKNLETGVTTRASTNATSTEGNGDSYIPFFSPDGNKLLFVSSATNLVAGDANGKSDLFLKDLTTGAITRVSTKADGTEGSDDSGYGIFLPDGKNIVFYSAAPNFVADDTNAKNDVFIKNIDSGNMSIISSNSVGLQGDGDSYIPFVSPDGTKVVFTSRATNLVPGDTNTFSDTFIKDIVSGKISRISTSAAGDEGNASSTFVAPSGFSQFSADGSKVVLTSSATNFVTGDTNAKNDIFVVDLAKATGGNDVLSGNEGADQIFGAPGGDTLIGGQGPDILNGGPGKDTADYSTSANAVKVSLQTGRGRGGDAQGDSLSAIENLTGSAKGDLMIGNALSNRLTGGKGLDKLSGKAGADRFVYTSIADSPAAAPDVIADFKIAEKDKVDLSAIDAKPATAANDAFTYIKLAAFSKTAGELRFNATTHRLEADTTGDGAADFAVTLTGINALPGSRIIP